MNLEVVRDDRLFDTDVDAESILAMCQVSWNGYMLSIVHLEVDFVHLTQYIQSRAGVIDLVLHKSLCFSQKRSSNAVCNVFGMGQQVAIRRSLDSGVFK